MEDDLEDTRAAAQKKVCTYYYCSKHLNNCCRIIYVKITNFPVFFLNQVKALEQQLEAEHEERIHFVREKHDLETKIMNLQELASRSADEDQVKPCHWVRTA